MKKKHYIAPAITTINVQPCPLMAGSNRMGQVLEDPNNPDIVDVTMPDGDATTSQEELMSLDDPHLWY